MLATDIQRAIRALLSGLEPVSPDIAAADTAQMRIRGESRAATVRASLLERMLPVPDTLVPVANVVRFRKKYAGLLPQLRLFMESKIDEVLALTDPILQSRLMDRIEDELLQRVQEAEAYLNEAGFRSVSRSTFLRFLKFIPFLKDPVEAGQDLAENLQTQPQFKSEPLAYLAFARTTLLPVQDYRVDPFTGIPLVEAIQ